MGLTPGRDNYVYRYPKMQRRFANLVRFYQGKSAKYYHAFGAPDHQLWKTVSKNVLCFEKLGLRSVEWCGLELQLAAVQFWISLIVSKQCEVSRRLWCHDGTIRWQFVSQKHKSSVPTHSTILLKEQHHNSHTLNNPCRDRRDIESTQCGYTGAPKAW